MDDEIRRLLEDIKEQTTRTNGRVMRLEEEVFGDRNRQTDGLIRQVATNTVFREQQETVARLVKWVVTPSVVVSMFTLLANLL